MKSYHRYVAAQSQRNPCLMDLYRFLTDSRSNRKPCRVASLDFFAGSVAPIRRNLDVASLRAELQCTYTTKHKHDLSSVLGQILIVEDLTKDIIEVLGSCLDIDPLFFASHVHAPWVEISSQTPDMATLPSRIRRQNFTNIHYHRTIVFEEISAPMRKLLRSANVHRKVMVLPPTKDTRVGLAQHCCSVLKTKQTGKRWLGIVLVDPPIENTYLSVQGQEQDVIRVFLPSQLFLGGYEDFLDPPSFFEDMSHRSGPVRHDLLEDLTYYWARHRPACFNPEAPTLLSLSFYPLKIVAAEWINYVAVMRHSIKEYEYSLEDPSGLSQKLDRLNSDMRALQAWRRRSMSSHQKIRCAARLIQNHKPQGLDLDCWSSLVADYEHVDASVFEAGRRLENMLPVVTTLVQIVDSRHAFAETANISRLTYLALVFVPLSFIASLFSMNVDVSPGGRKFWIYFVVALPVTSIVYLIARPPLRIIRVLRDHIQRLRQLQVQVSDGP